MNLTIADVLNLLAFASGIISIALAIFAIYLSRSAEKESRDNYEKTKEVLAQIDTRAAIIETTVQKAQDQLMNTVMKIIDEIVIPKKEDPAKLMFFKLMQENPEMQKLAMENFKNIVGNKKETT